jgi:hypothetical protein
LIFAKSTSWYLAKWLQERDIRCPDGRSALPDFSSPAPFFHGADAGLCKAQSGLKYFNPEK